MIELPPLAIGVIVAAIITGLISILGLIISKEQKVSEFRQAWVDSLRSELSMVISHANAIHGGHTAASAANRPSALSQTELWGQVRLDFVGINQATASVRLRLNPDERKSLDVLKHIDALERALAPGRAMPDSSKLNDIEKKLVDRAQVLLKKEWKRVKRGEPMYRVAQLVAGLLLVVALGVAIGSVL